MSLMVWLPFNGNLNNHGLSQITVTGGTVDNNGKIGKCYLVSKTAPITITQNLPSTSEWSIAFWAKLPASMNNATAWETMFSFPTINADTGSNSISNISWASYHNIKIYDDANHQWLWAAPGTHFNYDAWYHWTITHTLNGNGVQGKIYINGNLIGTYNNTTHQMKIRSGNISIGNGISTGGFYINDFRIYDHALSPLEVKHLAQGLVLNYPLDRQGFGQDNLYTGSKNFSGSWVNLSSWTTDSESYSGFTVKKKSSVWGGLAQNISCTNGDIFTISFYAKVDSGGNILSIHRSSLGNVTTGLTILDGNFKSGTDWVTINDDGTKWKYYWATVKITSSDITYLQWRIENSVTNKYLYICGMKLERGSIATLWTPAPSDDLYSQMGLNSNIEEDVSGYGNDGTRIGTFSWSSDTPRYNTSTYASGSASTYLQGSKLPSEAKTVSLWIKCSKTVNSAIFNDKTSGLQIGLLNSLLYINSLASTAGFTTTHWINDEWNHVVAINNNGTRSVYVNGQPETQSGASNYYLHNSDNFWLWKRSYNNSYTFTGSLSDLRIYVTALSADDVLELYHTPISLSNNGTLMTQGEYVEV